MWTTLPKVEGDLGAPEVDIKGPKVDVTVPDVWMFMAQTLAPEDAQDENAQD